MSSQLVEVFFQGTYDSWIEDEFYVRKYRDRRDPGWTLPLSPGWDKLRAAVHSKPLRDRYLYSNEEFSPCEYVHPVVAVLEAGCDADYWSTMTGERLIDLFEDVKEPFNWNRVDDLIIQLYRAILAAQRDDGLSDMETLWRGSGKDAFKQLAKIRAHMDGVVKEIERLWHESRDPAATIKKLEMLGAEVDDAATEIKQLEREANRWHDLAMRLGYQRYDLSRKIDRLYHYLRKLHLEAERSKDEHTLGEIKAELREVRTEIERLEPQPEDLSEEIEILNAQRTRAAARIKQLRVGFSS